MSRCWPVMCRQRSPAGEESARILEAGGDQSVLSTVAGKLARAMYADGRLKEAEAWADRSAELGASDDVMTQILWRQAKAMVLARRGEHAGAEQLARDAVRLADQTQSPNEQADAYSDLAEVLALEGRAQEAATSLREALSRYQSKENLAMAERTRGRLEILVPGQ